MTRKAARAKFRRFVKRTAELCEAFSKKPLELKYFDGWSDLMMVFGGLLVVRGVYDIYPPLAFIVAGMGLLRLSYLLALGE